MIDNEDSGWIRQMLQRTRLRAPALSGRGGWINTGGVSPTLDDFRGRLVLLDFWTSCCINCIRVADELRVLESRFVDELVVVGVHSPKFSHEGDHGTVVAAVHRHNITHAVLDDPDMTTWHAYGIRAWPTLVLIDQMGRIVTLAEGEGNIPSLAALIERLLESASGVSGQTPSSVQSDRPNGLFHPSKAIQLTGGNWLIANLGGNNVVEISSNLRTIVRSFGSGDRGREDGVGDLASFAGPAGLCLLPTDIASMVGYDVLVADSGNDALRAIRLSTGEVWAVSQDLASPWDVVYWEAIDRVVIAIAGRHRLAAFDPRSGNIAWIAGSGREGLRAGAAMTAEFAQPSGLAAEAGPEGVLWLVDAETSALRYVDKRGLELIVQNVIGKGLFEFGHRDGESANALLQHPTGVAIAGDGSILIADTFNGAIRRYSPDSGMVSTVVSSLSEPTGVASFDNLIVITESSNHRLLILDRPELQAAYTPQVEVNVVSALLLQVDIPLGPGDRLDEGHGSPIRLTVTSTPADLIVEGNGTGEGLTRSLTLSTDVAVGTLHVMAELAICVARSSTCMIVRGEWDVAIRVSTDGLPDLRFRVDQASN